MFFIHVYNPTVYKMKKQKTKIWHLHFSELPNRKVSEINCTNVIDSND